LKAPFQHGSSCAYGLKTPDNNILILLHCRTSLVLDFNYCRHSPGKALTWVE
jgi:hypothetical protein